MQHEHTPQIRPRLNVEHQPLRDALLGRGVWNNPKDVTEHAGLELGLQVGYLGDVWIGTASLRCRVKGSGFRF